MRDYLCSLYAECLAAAAKINGPMECAGCSRKRGEIGREELLADAPQCLKLRQVLLTGKAWRTLKERAILAMGRSQGKRAKRKKGAAK